MKLQTYPAVEPLWPYGTVAYLYITERDGKKDIGVRELVVRQVEPTDDGGWLVVADLPPHMLDTQDREFAFEVDSKGESGMCVPWDDEFEQEFNASVQRYTEAPGTEPERLSEPQFPSFDPDAGWTINPSPPPAHDVLDEDQEAVSSHGRHA